MNGPTRLAPDASDYIRTLYSLASPSLPDHVYRVDGHGYLDDSPDDKNGHFFPSRYFSTVSETLKIFPPISNLSTVIPPTVSLMAL